MQFNFQCLYCIPRQRFVNFFISSTFKFQSRQIFATYQLVNQPYESKPGFMMDQKVEMPEIKPCPPGVSVPDGAAPVMTHPVVPIAVAAGLSKAELRRLRKNEKQAAKTSDKKAKSQQPDKGQTGQQQLGKQPQQNQQKQQQQKVKTSPNQSHPPTNKENIPKTEVVESQSSQISSQGSQQQVINKDMPPGFREEPLKSILKKPQGDVPDCAVQVRTMPPLVVSGPPKKAQLASPIQTPATGKPSKPKPTVSITKGGLRKKSIYNHIPQRCTDIERLTADLRFTGEKIHPLVIRVGLSMNQGLISGSNPRCVAMLTALRRTIQDYIRPEQKEFIRDLQDRIDSQVEFIYKCRPPAVSMINAVKYLKLSLCKLQQQDAIATPQRGRSRLTDSEAKNQLVKLINSFIRDEIKLAQDGITIHALQKINDEGETILTYGCSPVVKQILYKAKQASKNFSVIVVDSRPRLQGKNMIEFCASHGIPVTYIYMNGISHVMRGVTKVLLGAHSLLANGYVMGQVGCSMISLVASAFNVPVLVCCETYKFSEKVDTDAFVHNELSTMNLCPPSPPLGTGGGLPSSEQSQESKFDTFNMLYDVTPPSLVSLILTEKGLLPCNSVPAVLRFRHEQSYLA